MLSGSRFVLAANDVDDPSIISSIAGPEPALVLLCESLPIDARIATLEKLTMDCPSPAWLSWPMTGTLRTSFASAKSAPGTLPTRHAAVRATQGLGIRDARRDFCSVLRQLRHRLNRVSVPGAPAPAGYGDAMSRQPFPARDPDPAVSHLRRLQQAHRPGAGTFRSHHEGSPQGDPAQGQGGKPHPGRHVGAGAHDFCAVSQGCRCVGT
jgi:hypothetical protein